MANQPPLQSGNSSYGAGNPFTDRPHVGFQEPSPHASTTSLSHDYAQHEDDIEEVEKPLSQFSGGFYPSP